MNKFESEFDALNSTTTPIEDPWATQQQAAPQNNVFNDDFTNNQPKQPSAGGSASSDLQVNCNNDMMT